MRLQFIQNTRLELKTSLQKFQKDSTPLRETYFKNQHRKTKWITQSNYKMEKSALLRINPLVRRA